LLGGFRDKLEMSALGQKRPFGEVRAMSALHRGELTTAASPQRARQLIYYQARLVALTQFA